MREILVAVEDGEKSKRVSDFVNRFFADLNVSITAVNVGRIPLAWAPRSLSPSLVYPWPCAGGTWPPAAALASSADLRAAAVDTAERALESSGVQADHHLVEAGTLPTPCPLGVD